MTLKKNIILAWTAALALLLAACDKEPSDVAAEASSEPMSVTIVISGLTQTKASELSSGDDAWSTDAAVTSYDIYFTDTFGTIKYVYSIGSSSDDDALRTAITASGGGIRFINLEGVSAIYVTANASAASSTTLTAGSNISDLAVDLASQNGLVDKSAILYIGADKSLTIDNEPAGANYTYSYDDGTADGSTAGWTNTTDNTPAYTASQYYYAELSIRPVVSRLEIGEIVTTHTGTTTAETIEINGQDYEYYILWEGFKPDLKGIYMSNFYGTLNPATPSVDNFFATPEGDYIDTAGENSETATYLWSSSAGTSIYGTSYNADGVTLYSDSGTNLWDGAADSSDSNYYVYFDGGSNYCVPFNFFVPFDVTEADDVIDKDATVMDDDHEPQYHLLFDTSEMTDYSYTLCIKGGDFGDINGDTYTNIALASVNNGTITDTETLAIFAALTANFSLSNSHYYANITSLSYVAAGSNPDGTSYASGDRVTLQPNKIYTVDLLNIEPYNLVTSTVSSEESNITVVVTVAGYTDQDVTNVLY